MITDKLKTILTEAGCTLVLYDQQQLINLYADRSDQLDIVGLIMQPPDVILEVRANAIAEHYAPLTIEVLQQANERLEDKAERRDDQLQTLLDICKEIIVRIIATAEYKSQAPYVATRVLENKYDANLVGWSLPLNLYILKNETREPCL
jgi:hypothetical protein